MNQSAEQIQILTWWWCWIKSQVCQLILREMWMSVQNFIAVHPTAVEIFESEPKWWTNQHAIWRAMLLNIRRTCGGCVFVFFVCIWTHVYIKIQIHDEKTVKLFKHLLCLNAKTNSWMQTKTNILDPQPHVSEHFIQICGSFWNIPPDKTSNNAKLLSGSNRQSAFAVLCFSKSYKVLRENSVKGPQLINVSSAICRN